MQVFEFIYKLENKGLKAINFDSSELKIEKEDVSLDISQEDGIGVIKIPSKKKLKNLADLRYYLIVKDKSYIKKVAPLLDNHFLNQVYALNDGTIIILITNENQEKVAITDVAIDNMFYIENNTLKDLKAWFDNPQSTNGVAKNKENEEELNASIIEDYMKQRVEKDIEVNTQPIKFTPPPKAFGEKVILVADRFLKEDTIRKAYSVYRNKEQYQNAPVYNFYALLDDNGNSYMLEIISLIEQIKINPANKIELYEKMRTICKNWFTKVKSLGVTDFVSRRVFQSDRLLTPEIVMWLWGYFVIGQQCNWILTDGSIIRIMKNEFQDSDLKTAAFYRVEARKALTVERKYVVNTPDLYLAIGCANYLMDTGFQNTNDKWYSDNISFESHLAGFIGGFTREPHSIPIEKQIDSIVNSNRYEIYKNFVKKYYNV